MAETADPFVAALLSALLPGDGDWPSAVTTGAPAWFAGRLAALPPLAEAVAWLRSELPADFAARDPAGRAAALRSCERKDAARFATVVTEALNGYYIDPAVLVVVERKTGFPARPPQPEGHRLEPFDVSILRGRGRPPSPR
jgi:hypothetical protein